MRFSVLITAIVLLGWQSGLGQSWGRVEGYVRELPANSPVPGATIIVDGTDFGTAADRNGYYSLRLPSGSFALRISFVGLTTRTDSVTVRRGELTRHDVTLDGSPFEMDEITVEDDPAVRDIGVYEIRPEDLHLIPGPFKDGFSALKVMPGVATNNELSNQYSVRGGGFNENLIYVHGFEVFKPFRVKQGEQEGLGLLNPELADRLTFYTGGFPARYGGKLSSVLDVAYRRMNSTGMRGSAYVSTLDAGITSIGAIYGGRLGWTVGARKARGGRFFGTQELKGVYEPDYTDVQGLLSYRIAPGHEFQFLGMYADHQFNLEPNQRRTYFGTLEDLRSIWFNYSGFETDGYHTALTGARLTSQLSSNLRLDNYYSWFSISENERYDISGAATLYRVDVNDADPSTGRGHIPTGNVQQRDRAENRVDVAMHTFQSTGLLAYNRFALEAGWNYRLMLFEDDIFEESSVRGHDSGGNPVNVVLEYLEDDAAFDAWMTSTYLQSTVDLLPETDRLLITAGARMDYFSFNDELTLSPRFTLRYALSNQSMLLAGAGLYHQSPTYREFRGQTDPGETIIGSLNRDLRSQRSLQLTGGIEHFLTQYRLYVRAEAYYKHLNNLISYNVDNVRINYSGDNDTDGRVYGMDFQIRGEFVPGLESWANYSYMVAQERFIPTFTDAFNRGTIPRPTDQRHTFSMFVQDYVPGDDTWQLHLRILFGTGLPYTPPRPGETIGNITLQESGRRFSERYPEYKRIDIGATKLIIPLQRSFMDGIPVELSITGEILNVFDMTNTIAYSWIAGHNGVWQRIPTRLTPRTYNVRFRLQF